MREPYILTMGELKKRRIWKSGSSWVVPLPNDLIANHMEKDKPCPVYLDRLDESSVLLTFDQTDPFLPSPKYVAQADDPIRLETAIYGAYMGGYESIKLEIPPKYHKSREMLSQVQSKLYGTFIDPIKKDVKTTVFRFNEIPELDKNIFKWFVDIGDKIEEMYNNNKDVMSEFSNENIIDEKIDTVLGVIDGYESDLDRASFYLKRLLNKALYNPELFNEMGLREKRRILHYNTIVNNLERIGDLHYEIINTLRELRKKYIKEHQEIKLKMMEKFYELCHKDVRTALDVIKSNELMITDFTSRRRIVDKESGIWFIPNVYSKENAENMINYIENNSTYSRLLTILESKISGLRGNASNIIEAKYNMNFDNIADRPERKGERET